LLIFNTTKVISATLKHLRGLYVIPVEKLIDVAPSMNDFPGQNPRGRNFKELDLTGAKFSGADIRGAKFTNKVLRGANFTGAKAGLQKRWVILQTVMAFLLSAIPTFVSIFLAALLVSNLVQSETTDRYTIFLGLVALFALVAIYCAIACQGLTTKALRTIVLFVAVAGAVASVGALILKGTIAGIGALTSTVTSTIAGASAVTVMSAVAGALAGTVAVAVIAKSGVAVAVEVLTVLLSFYVAWRVSKEDEKFALSRNFGIALSALGGTNFQGADLTGATFSGVLLKNTNSANSRKQKTILAQVCWKDAKRLNRDRVGDSILTARNVRELLTSGNGINQPFERANFRGANLTEAKLNGAILKRADLGEAILTYADL
ncbi:MAG: pentapeptide repeat-containing protein, partial [Phormidesmis sp. CAN_BIN44]|nr:pentapeptide repeat-containing protein [Phormidesmis sp. CAN_BIN44]